MRSDGDGLFRKHRDASLRRAVRAHCLGKLKETQEELLVSGTVSASILSVCVAD